MSQKSRQIYVILKNNRRKLVTFKNSVDLYLDYNIDLGERVRLGKNVAIGENCVIRTGCVIGDNVAVLAERLNHNVSVGSHSILQKNSWIGSGVRIGKNCLISRDVNLRAGVVLEDNVKIRKSAEISDDILLKKGVVIPKYFFLDVDSFYQKVIVPAGAKCILIEGSNHRVLYWGQDKIAIGCKILSIESWIHNGIVIGEASGYNASEIAEYKRYVDRIAKAHQKFLEEKKRLRRRSN